MFAEDYLSRTLSAFVRVSLSEVCSGIHFIEDKSRYF